VRIDAPKKAPRVTSFFVSGTVATASVRVAACGSALIAVPNPSPTVDNLVYPLTFSAA
jgi:hypothetical protein